MSKKGETKEEVVTVTVYFPYGEYLALKKHMLVTESKSAYIRWAVRTYIKNTVRGDRR